MTEICMKLIQNNAGLLGFSKNYLYFCIEKSF